MNEYSRGIVIDTGNLILSLNSGLSAHFQIPVVLSDVGCQLVELLRGDTPVRYPHLLDIDTPGYHELDCLHRQRNPAMMKCADC